MSKARRWRIVAFVVATLGTRAAHAQGTVIGVVEDSAGAPIMAASVLVAGSNFGVATDVTGRFRFPSLPVKVWTLEIRRLGYAPITTEVDVRNRDTVSLSITLIPAAFPIAPVVVSETGITPKLREVGFERRRKLEIMVPARQFVTRQQIEKQNPMRVSQVVGRMGRPSQCHPASWAIYVDGVLRGAAAVDPPPRPGSSAPVPRPSPVDDIPPGEIEGIEVYVGGLQIPFEFRTARRDVSCVIVIWTRSGY